jgi:hypothetical protein
MYPQDVEAMLLGPAGSIVILSVISGIDAYSPILEALQF